MEKKDNVLQNNGKKTHIVLALWAACKNKYTAWPVLSDSQTDDSYEVIGFRLFLVSQRYKEQSLLSNSWTK